MILTIFNANATSGKKVIFVFIYTPQAIKLGCVFRGKLCPRPADWVGKHDYQIMISYLLCHNDTIDKEWLKSIKYFKGEHAQPQIELRKGWFLQFLKDGILENQA